MKITFMRILGVDPGSVICGYGIIDKDGEKLSIVEYGVIKAKKCHNELPYRLKEIYNRLTEVIKRVEPDEVVFETIFYSKNVQSLIKLSHARSAAVLATVLKDIPFFEYSPKEVKKSVTGRGGASKEQVQFMIKKILNITDTLSFYDVSDALAIAICHSYKRDMPLKSTNSWNEFIKNNPERVVNSS